jgi:hypothetical protein
MNNNANKYSLRSNKKGYGGKTHKTDSQNSDTTAPSGRAVPFVVLAPRGQPETFGYTLMCVVSDYTFPFRVFINAVGTDLKF